MRLHRLVASLIVTAACHGLAPSVAQSEIIVRMDTSLGTIDIELFDQTAPNTVVNFLNYARDGDYDNSFIHRSSVDILGRPFVIQGGSFSFSGTFDRITEDPPVANEFDLNDPDRSNLRGTIAMAKLPGDPDSATSGWFFNMANNSTNLDFQNGGFTVFGRVFGSNTDSNIDNDGTSMLVVDSIAALNRFNGTGLDPRFDSEWTEMPLIGFSAGQTFDPPQNLVLIRSIRETNYLQRLTSLAGNSVTLTVPTPARLAAVTATTNPDLTNTPANVDFAEGFFDFQVNGLSPGASIQVAMVLPTDFLPNTYYIYGPTPDNAAPHWYEFRFNGQTGAEFFGNNVVVLHFIDGQRGDADLAANGVIMDPGAPGIDTAPQTSTSSNGGGCTLVTAGRSSTSLDGWLFILALAAHLYHQRHKGVSKRRLTKGAAYMRH